MTVLGIVKEGVVVPSSPLPNGAQVEIRLLESPLEFSPEMQAEFDAWNRTSADALELVERLAREGDLDEKR